VVRRVGRRGKSFSAPRGRAGGNVGVKNYYAFHLTAGGGGKSRARLTQKLKTERAIREGSRWPYLIRISGWFSTSRGKGQGKKYLSVTVWHSKERSLGEGGALTCVTDR